MFARSTTTVARLAARQQSQRLAVRTYATKPSGGFWSRVPVETYPLIGVVTFACCLGVGMGWHAFSKEKEDFLEHKSTGSGSVKYNKL